MSKEEFAVFAGKYMDMIYRVAYSWMKNSHDANDVTQEVLIQLYRTTKEFESDSHMKNWLIRVTVNQCKMLFRSPRNHMEDIEDYAETLGFEDKSYLDLFCAVMKIADLLGLPGKTVSTRLFRAKTKLKVYLKEE